MVLIALSFLLRGDLQARIGRGHAPEPPAVESIDAVRPLGRDAPVLNGRNVWRWRRRRLHHRGVPSALLNGWQLATSRTEVLSDSVL